MTEKCYDALKKYFLKNEANLEKAVYIAADIAAYSGNLQWANTYDFDEYLQVCIDGGLDDVKAFVEQCVIADIYDGQIRFDDYGRLLSGEMEDLIIDLEDNMEQFLNYLDDYIDEDGQIYNIDVCEPHDELDCLIKNNSDIEDDETDDPNYGRYKVQIDYKDLTNNDGETIYFNTEDEAQCYLDMFCGDRETAIIGVEDDDV